MAKEDEYVFGEQDRLQGGESKSREDQCRRL